MITRRFPFVLVLVVLTMSVPWLRAATPPPDFRNPQTCVKNIFEAKPSDFHKATQTVYRSPQCPSNIELPVMSAAAQP